jgi:prefoldin alpha subunit
MEPTLEEMQAQLNYELAIYKEQVHMIKRETERISLTTVDLSNALKSVENLAKEKVMIPIGGGAMVKGQVSEVNVMIPIGAQYMVEMDQEKAKKELEKRIEATKKAVTRLTEEFNKIAKKLQDTSAQLQNIESRAQINERVDANIREDYI